MLQQLSEGLCTATNIRRLQASLSCGLDFHNANHNSCIYVDCSEVFLTFHLISVYTEQMDGTHQTNAALECGYGFIFLYGVVHMKWSRVIFKESSNR